MSLFFHRLLSRVCAVHVGQAERDRPKMLHTYLPGQVKHGCKSMYERVDRDIGRGTATVFNYRKTRKMTLLSIKTQQPAGTIRFRIGKKFLSHANGNRKPGWKCWFLLSFGRGRSKAPSFSMADEREGSWRDQKVEVCLLLTIAGLFHVIFVYHGVLCSTLWCV